MARSPAASELLMRTNVIRIVNYVYLIPRVVSSLKLDLTITAVDVESMFLSETTG